MSLSVRLPALRIWLSLVLSLLAGLLATLALALLNPVAVYAGTITVVDGDAAPADGTYTDGWIQAQLASGNLTINTGGVGSGPDDIRVEPSAVVTWTSGSLLTLRAQNDIVISATIQHDGPENGEGGLRLIADADKDGSGGVQIGTGSQSVGVAAGSRHGLTRVGATDLVLLGGASNLNSYAMLGFLSAGHIAPFTITGAVSVTVSNHITATAGAANGAYVQIGHGGEDVASITSAGCVIGGPIAIHAGGDVTFKAGRTYSYAQLGNGGYLSEGDHGGDHTLSAVGDVTFEGGDSSIGYSQFGNGGHSVNGNHSGSHSLSAGGNVTFRAGIAGNTYAQLGNGGQEATGSHSGSHMLSAPSGSVTFQGGDSFGDYAQLGNGGYEADGAPGGGHSGGHRLISGGDVTFKAGLGDYAYAQLGNGGYYADCLPGAGHSGGHSLEAKGDVLFEGGGRAGAFAQMGNGGFDADGSHSGSHSLVSESDVTFQGSLVPGGWGTYAHMGNGGYRSDGDHSGDQALTGSGDVSFLAGISTDAYAQFGNGGSDVTGNHSGALKLTSGGDVTVAEGSGVESHGLVGHGGYPDNSAGERAGDISVRVGATAVFTDAIIGHVTVDGLPSITQGSTYIGVSQLDPYATGAGKLIAKGVTTFTSASAANGGELRFYLPRLDSQEIPTTASFNGEHFAAANTIPVASLRGFYLFGDGPYAPKYSFYLGGLPDAGIVKTVAPAGALRLGDPLTYTLTFSNSGSNTAIGVRITDTLPAALAGASVSTSLDAGVSVTQTGSAPDLAWQVSNLGVGKGGMITIMTALKNDAGLLGTKFGNNVIISATSDITPTNNAASTESKVIAPAAIVITKTVVGPSPGGKWDFSGSGGIGSFSLPKAGGSTTLTPLQPGVSYTIEEITRAAYSPSVSCTDGSSGVSKVTVKPAAGKTIGCTFTNTYVRQTVTVNKVVVGGTLAPKDCSLYIDGGPVQSGVPAELAAGVHTVSEASIAGYAASFSGDCSASGVVNLGIGQQAVCVLTNTYSPPATGGIAGVVFEDLNGNGEQDKDEPGVRGVLVTLTNETQSAAPGAPLYEDTDTTGADGGYGFQNVPVGRYTLKLKPPAEFAAPSATTVVVKENQVIGVPPVSVVRKDSPVDEEAVYLPSIFKQ